MPFALDRLQPLPREKILDAGTGPGNYAITVAKSSASRVVGVDISRNFIERAKKNADLAGVPEIEFVHGDLEELPFDDGYFDKIICGGALQATPDRDRAASELFRVLKPGGRAVIVEPHKTRAVSDRLFLLMMYVTGLPSSKLRAVGARELGDYYFEEEALVKLLTGTGFSNVEATIRAGSICASCIR